MKKLFSPVWRVLFSHSLFLVAIATIGLSTECADAAPLQPGQQNMEFVDRFNKQFEGRAPKVGAQMLEELTAFDGAGKEFKFESLKGKHTVIVFGCLT